MEDVLLRRPSADLAAKQSKHYSGMEEKSEKGPLYLTYMAQGVLENTLEIMIMAIQG